MKNILNIAIASIVALAMVAVPVDSYSQNKLFRLLFEKFGQRFQKLIRLLIEKLGQRFQKLFPSEKFRQLLQELRGRLSAEKQLLRLP